METEAVINSTVSQGGVINSTITTGTTINATLVQGGSGGPGAPGPNTVAGLITQGSGIAITGSGTSSNPYNIASTVAGGVSSVFGRTGAVVVQSGDYSVSQVTGAAPLASPALTGVPTAPTATTGTNTTQIATTAFVNATAIADTPAATFTTNGTVKQTVYNVRDYGAVGDGVTDDTTAINSAISALPTEGGVILFPHGIYLISSTITIKHHGVILLGEGFSSVFADQANQQAGIKGGSVIKASTTTWVSGDHLIVFGVLGTNQMWTGGGVYNLVLEGTKGYISTGDGIQILNVQAVRITDNNITGFSNGVYVSSDQSGGISNVIIEHNIINGLNNYGIKLDGGSDLNYVRFNYISGWVGHSIWINGDGSTITGNHIESGVLAGSGFADGTAIFSSGQYSLINQNDMAVGCPSHGIYISANHSQASNNEMTNVNGSGVANGSGIWVDGSITDVAITDNLINDNGGNMVYGIRDTSTTAGGVFIGPQSITGATTAAIYSANNEQANQIILANMGVGQVSPSARLHVTALSSQAGIRSDAPQGSDLFQGFVSGSQYFGVNYKAGNYVEIQSYQGKVLAINDQGNNVAIGKSTAGTALDVNGTITSTGLKMTTSPTSGYVLTSDSAGNASWQSVSSTTYTAGTGLTLTGSSFALSVPVSIANGGTGSTTQNFVDLTTNQTIAGTKTFSSDIVVNGQTIGKGLGGVSTNVVHGVSALASNTTGNDNIAIGSSTLNANTTGYDSIAIGFQALKSAVSVGYNIGIGSNSLTLVTAQENVAVGRGTLQADVSGDNNTAIGDEALYSTTSYGNTALGSEAGYSLTTGNSNTFVGRNAGNNASQLVSASNSTAIGYSAYTTASNQIVLGNGSVTQIVPQTTGVTSLGSSSIYWLSADITTLNLNSTASISGTTAGVLAVTGTLTATSPSFTGTPTINNAPISTKGFAIAMSLALG
jgi:Pectate lyase superfamily protein